MLNFFTKRSVGIDIADRTIEVVEILKDRDGTRIWSKGRVTLEPGVVERGRVKDKIKLSQALKKVLREAKPHPIITRRAVFGLPECQVYINNFYITEHKKEDREEIIIKEALENFPLEKENLVYSYRIIPSKGKKTEVLLVAADRSAVNEWRDFLRGAGVEIKAFDVESLAVFRGLFPEPPKNPVCVIDIGAATSHIAIFDKNSLWYSYCNNIAGNALTAEAALALKKSEAEAEQIKKEIGLSIPGERIFFALTKVLHPLAEDIKTTLDYFKEKTGESVEGLILVGGSSKLKGLADYLQTNIGIPLKIGKSALLKTKADLVYIEAAGLALMGVDAKWSEKDPFITIDGRQKGSPAENPGNVNSAETPAGESAPKEKQKMVFRSRARGRVMALIFVIVAGLVAFSAVYLYRARENARREENARAKIEAVKALEKIKSERVKKEEKLKAELEAAKKAAEQVQEITVKKTPTGWLNSREGPGTGYAKIGKVYPGETYELLDEKNNWYKIKIPANGEGENNETEAWIISKYADKE